MVKAHLARITRVTQSYSGDPVVIQRANSLLQAFEKEVQEPHNETARHETKKALAEHSAKRKEPVQRQRKASVKARPVAKPAKILRRHPKPLVKKAGIARRRARR